MRKPSGRMRPHSATLQFQTWNTDPDGGRIVTSTRTVREVPCLYTRGRSETIIEESEMGLKRVTKESPLSFQFAEDVGLNIHDLIRWTDDSGGNHLMRVTGYDPAPMGSYWIAWCEQVD